MTERAKTGGGIYRARGKCVWEEVQNRQRRSKLGREDERGSKFGRGTKRARGKLDRGGKT